MERSQFYLNLTDQEVLIRRNQFGLNELPTDKKKSSAYYIIKILKEPMLLLMVAAAGLYLVIGDWQEGLLLGISVFFVIGLSYYQEQKSSRALEKLKKLSSPRALVIRSGIEKRIPANELVPGDLVILTEGDRIPADGFLLESFHLKIDESLLTGEAFSIEKSSWSKNVDIEFMDSSEIESIPDNNKVFCSTLVVAGRGVMRVQRIGLNTEVGKIGVSLREPAADELNLNFEIRQLVKIFAWTGVVVSIVLILLYGFSKGNWIQAILLGLATQMSLLPEEFPVILTIFMALGAWRLSKVKMLVRNPTAIERLGAVTVLCVDKTGTLTENKMTVGKLFDGNDFISPSSSGPLPKSYRDILLYAALASPKNPFDPMEIALSQLAEKEIEDFRYYLKYGKILKEVGLSDKMKATTFFWESPSVQNSVFICMKGAPETVMDHCHLSVEEIKKFKDAVHSMAVQGFRVLAVASAKISKTNLSLKLPDQTFDFAGLVGFEDPLRNEVPEAVKICRKAGIRVIMMTGDHAQTALKIAHLAGLNTNGSVITGQDIEKMSDDEFMAQLDIVDVFARMIPAQKLRLVKLLKKQGQIVAMTGDGVNDAPSLKWADIGIAMGLRGTDVAREASDIVLMDDNFSSIVSGIKRGRIIFNNI